MISHGKLSMYFSTTKVFLYFQIVRSNCIFNDECVLFRKLQIKTIVGTTSSVDRALNEKLEDRGFDPRLRHIDLCAIVKICP